MENYYLIYECELPCFRVYLNQSNSDLVKKFNQINRSNKQTEKFVLIIEAVRMEVANKTQYNKESTCDYGTIYAIKIDEHRFYTIESHENGCKELYISRYGRKQTQTNDKKLTNIIDSISKIEITKVFK